MRLAPIFLSILFSTCALAQVPAEQQEPVMIDVTDFDENSVQAYTEQIHRFKQEGKTNLWIRINSFGGSVFDGLDLAREIESYGTPVTCVADIRTMSMGFYFLQFCDKRLATKRTVFMIHGPKGSVQGGSEQEIETKQHFLEATKQALAEQIAKRTHLTKQAFLEKISHGDWFMDWEEALKIGAIDDTIDSKCLPESTPVVKRNNLFDMLKELKQH